MRQALHIFKKDVRYLRYEIALVLLIASAFAAMHARASHGQSNDTWWAQLALVVAAAFLIGRLILAEAIPGDRQFWITRPYRWQSLLGAKLLFILTFLNLPVLMAQVFIVTIDGFPLASSLPGLIWSQVLLFAFAALPFAAIAALNSSMTPFIFTQITILAVVFGPWEVRQHLYVAQLGGVEWVRDSIAAVALAAVVILVILIQYKSRRTLFSRWVALGGIALGALAFTAMPPQFALAVQSGFSKQPSLGSSIQATFGRVPENQFSSGQVPGKVAMVFPILLRGLPEGTDVQGDVFSISLQSPDVPASQVNAIGDCANFSRTPMSEGSSIIHVNCFIDTRFFGKQRDRPMTLHASLYFTLFGNAQSRSMPLSSEFLNAPGGLQCTAESGGPRADSIVKCRSAFRWPARLVYERRGDSDENTAPEAVSYSPFPADLSIDPVETYQSIVSVGGPRPRPTIHNVTVIVEEPLGHLRRDVVAHDVQLDDFADPSIRRR